jgi:hypothetical protein
MTWRELKNYINKQARENKDFLNEVARVFDFHTGSEHEADVTELHGDSEEDESGWVPYLSINTEDVENETETKEASVD